jgi:hypothetical protein
MNQLKSHSRARERATLCCQTGARLVAGVGRAFALTPRQLKDIGRGSK